MNNKKWTIFRIVLLIAMTILQLAAVITSASAAPGAIWTTTGACGDPQNVNNYNVGDQVFVNGAGFGPSTTEMLWKIVGKPGGASGDPGQVVANGAISPDINGEFCFYAYTIQSDDWGEYSVKIGSKSDNYHVANEDPMTNCTLTLTCTEAMSMMAHDPSGYDIRLFQRDPATAQWNLIAVAQYDPVTWMASITITEPGDYKVVVYLDGSPTQYSTRTSCP